MNVFKLNKPLVLILFVVLIDYMGIGLIYPILCPLIMHPNSTFVSAGLSNWHRSLVLGVLLSSMPVSQLICSPISGYLSDKYGRRPIFLSCLCMAVISYSIAIFAMQIKSISILMLSRVLLGIAGSSVAVVQAVITDICDSKSKPEAFGLFNMMLGIGYTLGPFVGGKLAGIKFLSLGGMVLPFLVTIFLIVASWIIVFFCFEETLSITAEPTAATTEKCLSEKSVPITTLLLCSVFFSFGWSFFFECAPIYLVLQYKMEASNIGNFYAYAGGLYAVSCSVLIRPVLKRYSHTSIMLYSLVLSGIYIMMFVFCNAPNHLWFYLPVLLFLISLVYSTLTTVVSNHTDKYSQGKQLGIMQSLQSLAFAVGPFIACPLTNFNLFMPIILGGLSMIVSALFFFSFLKTAVRQ